MLFVVGAQVLGSSDLSEVLACCLTKGLGRGVAARDNHRPSGQEVSNHKEYLTRYLQGIRLDAYEGPRRAVVYVVGVRSDVVECCGLSMQPGWGAGVCKCGVICHRLEGFWELTWDDGEGPAVFVGQ